MAILYTLPTQYNQYENAVLQKIVDQSYQIMSDIWGTADWALVWDKASASPKRVLVNVYDMNPADWKPVQIEVDASEEVKEAYFNWQVKNLYESLVSQAEDEARRIRKGSIAEVVRGRNGKGERGKVVVVMTAPYRMGYRAVAMEKYGIATSDVTFKKALPNGKVVDAHQDMVWAWAKNCRRVDVAEIDKEALLLEATERVKRSSKV